MIQTSENYDEQWSRLYDFIRFNPGARHRRRLLKNVLREISLDCPTIIDAGCGLGFNVQALASALPTATITGTDFSAIAIDGAKKRFPNQDWILADLNNPPKNLRASIVVCTEVIEHVEDHTKLLSNLAKMVADFGYLVLTTQSGKVHDTERHVGHVRHFEVKELTDELTNMGFRIHVAKAWGWPGYVSLKYIANINSEKTLGALGSGTYGLIARALNNIAYLYSWWFSLQNSSRGCQIIIVAQKK